MAKSCIVKMSCSTNKIVEYRRIHQSKRRKFCNKDEETVVDESPQLPVLRRSERERQLPDYYGEQSGEQMTIVNELKESTTVKEALTT